MTTTLPDGQYTIHPDGGASTTYRVESGRIVASCPEALHATHEAARDGRAMRPGPDDPEITGPELDALLALVTDYTGDPGACCATRAR